MDAPITWTGYGRRLRPPAESLESPIARFDLELEVERLLHEEAWRDSGHDGKTLSKHGGLRVVLSVLKATHRIPTRRLHGASSLQILSGAAQVQCGEQTMELLPGQIVMLEHDVPLTVEAISDCAFLVTLVPHAG